LVASEGLICVLLATTGAANGLTAQESDQDGSREEDGKGSREAMDEWSANPKLGVRIEFRTKDGVSVPVAESAVRSGG